MADVLGEYDGRFGGVRDALAQGYLVGEVIRRVTSQSVGTFLAKEVAGPLDADFHIGLDPEDFHRVANVIPSPPMATPTDLGSLVVTYMMNRMAGGTVGDQRGAGIVLAAYAALAEA